jgi:hypothetical protein
MWEPQCLPTLWASTACYRDNFTFTPDDGVISFVKLYWIIEVKADKKRKNLHPYLMFNGD